MILVTQSISPQKPPDPRIRFQPSMLSVPSAASTVKPEQQAPVSQAQRRPAARRKLWFFTALAVVAGALGTSILGGAPAISTQVHSGSPGFKQGKQGQPLHWHDQAVSVYLDESLKRIGPTAEDAVMQSFGRWVESNPHLPNLRFDTGKTSATPKHDGKSTVSYGPIHAPGHERDLAITVTYSNEETGAIIEADIVLNSMYPMGVLTAKPHGKAHDPKHHGSDGNAKANGGVVEDCQNRYDIQNVTTHEVGHFFGLGEDSTERGAAMFQAIDQCETHKRELSPTDVNALSTLYTERQDPEETRAVVARACSFAGALQPRGGGWGLGLVLGVGLLARRRRAR